MEAEEPIPAPEVQEDQLSENSELIIALVGAVGTNLKAVKKILKDQVERAGYDFRDVKISRDVIRPAVDLPENYNREAERYDAFITAGNQICEDAEEKQLGIDARAALAYGVAAHIFSERPKTEEAVPLPNFKTAYIIDSLKRPQEVECLRAVYPDGFVLVGCYANEADRRKHLCGNHNEQMTEEEATELFQRDINEEKEKFGQRVRKTFHQSDFFLHVTEDKTRLTADVERMVELLFGNPFLTPTFDEYAMYMAFAAALRSADLSRQVGAVVAQEESKEVLSTGANDCPKHGGGLYWPWRQDSSKIEDDPEGRDYMRGEDSNNVARLEIIQEIVTLVREQAGQVDEVKLRKALENSSIGDLTEFGRVVHAEMEALLACARNRVSTRGATVYCTTFPCHNCAKHIVASGVDRVVYIEPYEKSKAFVHHPDSIVAAEPGGDYPGKVKFEPFVGVGPRKFFDLFSMKHGSGYPLERKNRQDGAKREWSIDSSQLRLQLRPTDYTRLEFEAGTVFSHLMQEDEND